MTTETAPHEVNLRKCCVLGGVLHLDLLDQPPQPRDLSGKYVITVCEYMKIIFEHINEYATLVLYRTHFCSGYTSWPKPGSLLRALRPPATTRTWSPENTRRNRSRSKKTRGSIGKIILCDHLVSVIF